MAAGIVGDFFTVGTEAEFKRTIKAQDGDSLAEDEAYESADRRARRTTGSGTFYIDLKPFIEQALKSDPQAAGQLEQFRSIFPIDKLEPLSRRAARRRATGSRSTRSRAGRASTR